MAQVLVTGGSGFIGAHGIVALLAAGHQVRTTVRDLSREDQVRTMLAAGGAPAAAPVEFVVADLEQDAGWAEAARGCDYVMHVASPFPLANPRHEDELIRPAVEGTRRVMQAAREAGVRRVVLTSSFAAIGYGHAERAAPLTEADWSDVTAPDCMPYMKSKTLAERAAWAAVADGGGPELATVNPVAVFGPALGPDLSSSIEVVRKLLGGEFPATPRIYFGAVDVRDVASLHLLAMTEPQAAGERFLAVAGRSLSVHEVAQVLRVSLGAAARKVPKHETPDWAVRLLALVNKQAREVVPHLGKRRTASADKARRLLGWRPRPPEEAILASAESLMRLGLVKG